MTIRRLVILCVLAFSAGCGGNSTTAPSTGNPGTPTRIIQVSGNVQFGAVAVGSSLDGLLVIANNGNSPLTVTSITGPSSACVSMFAVSWSNGTIQPGTSQNVTLRFSPTQAINCSGTVTVQANQTSGSPTIQINASGSLDGVPVFSKGGTGDTVFDIPKYVNRLRIQADYGGYCQNFIVHVGGDHIVNVILGPCSIGSHFDGTYNVPVGGQVEIVNSTGVRWLFLEQR